MSCCELGLCYFALCFLLLAMPGLVSFGGAWTTLPFVYNDCVTINGWLTPDQFLAAIAITNLLPTPLVTFVTFIGYVGAGVAGAVVMTIGMFLPSFAFPIIGHHFFEAMTDNRIILPFLDGVSASVIGLLSVTPHTFMMGSVKTGDDSVVFLLAFAAVFYFTDKLTQPILINAAAIAGKTLFG